MTFKQTNDRIIERYGRGNSHYSVGDAFGIEFVFSNQKDNDFDFNEKIKINSYVMSNHGDKSLSGRIKVVVNEKNSRLNFIGLPLTKWEMYTKDYPKFINALVSGYVKLGKATSDFYDSF